MRITSKGQVTIPKAIRDELGLKPNDRIEFTIEHGQVTLRRARLSLAEMAGMLPPLGIDVEKMPAVAREDWVDRYVDDHG